jgi:mRNA-degrading endonuclease toxin of MazEF toxin-antitoxin module
MSDQNKQRPVVAVSRKLRAEEALMEIVRAERTYAASRQQSDKSDRVPPAREE